MRSLSLSRLSRLLLQVSIIASIPWIEWDDNTKSGKFLHKPERADIPENIKEQLIVELYSK